MTDRILSVLQHDDPSGAVVLTVTGELDHHSAPELTLAIRETPFTADRPTIIDLTGLTYCDSTGITVLVTAYQRAKREGGALVIAGLNSDLMSVFRIVGLDQILVFAPTVQDAVELGKAAGRA